MAKKVGKPVPGNSAPGKSGKAVDNQTQEAPERQVPRTEVPPPANPKVAGGQEASWPGSDSVVKGKPHSLATETIAITPLPVDQLRPNPLNPNVLTGEAFAGLVEEVRRQGCPPKPIVVRPVDGGFEIVDGEHAWRAAKEVGLAQVPCQVIEVDHLEAMRQTYTRNQHGEQNPVLLGRFFQNMLQEGKLSNRQLAEKLHIDEATVRNHLKYAEAAEVRNHSAPEGGDNQIAALPVAKVKLYLAIPEDQRDQWLDRGAPMEEGEALRRQANEKAPAQETGLEAQEAMPPAQEAAATAEETAPADDQSQGPHPSARSEPQPDDAIRGAAPSTGQATKKSQRGRDSAPSPVQVEETKVEKLPTEHDGQVYQDLKAVWDRASSMVRRKFLASLWADREVINELREMVKRGS